MILKEGLTNIFPGKRLTIPDENVEGYIKESFGEVLGAQCYTDDVLINPPLVTLEAKSEQCIDAQMWIKGLTDSDGWFTLTNSRYTTHLTAGWGSILYLEGKANYLSSQHSAREV